MLWLHGFALFAVSTLFGLILISTFSVTVIIGSILFPNDPGVASGLPAGFAVGAGEIRLTLPGVIAGPSGSLLK